MQVYIVYRFGDRVIPVAITRNREVAAKYVQKQNKESGWKQYFIERRIVSNEITNITGSV